ncbi:HAAS signaling domain-containing protein [Kocuria sp.]|uniref:HAAS signaling domain-containing protein n=1 Tax=Kocuria sp. TaxID=1871328 RepID=UPI0026E0569A|nr:hypothetical protein [Kocuria sp.]MDO5617840.1 hypothetical protein [Kocuria sp.]
MSSRHAPTPAPTTGSVESHEAWTRPFVRTHSKWCNAFMTELRLAEVPGAQIGDHLAEVETHCIESGQEPAEAFGDPVEYAQSLVSESSPVPGRGTWRVAVFSAAQVLCLMVGTAAVNHWVRGDAMVLNLVQIACLVLMTALLLALPVVMRPVIRRPVVLGAGLFALFVVLGVGVAAGERLALPALVTVPSVLAAVVAFAGILVLSVLNFMALRGADDPMASPLSQPENARSAGISGVWLNVMIASMVPVTFLVLAAAAWLMA